MMKSKYFYVINQNKRNNGHQTIKKSYTWMLTQKNIFNYSKIKCLMQNRGIICKKKMIFSNNIADWNVYMKIIKIILVLNKYLKRKN